MLKIIIYFLLQLILKLDIVNQIKSILCVTLPFMKLPITFTKYLVIDTYSFIILTHVVLKQIQWNFTQNSRWITQIHFSRIKGIQLKESIHVKHVKRKSDHEFNTNFRYTPPPQIIHLMLNINTLQHMTSPNLVFVDHILRQSLTQCGTVQHKIIQWLFSSSATSYYPKQYWLIANWTLRNQHR